MEKLFDHMFSGFWAFIGGFMVINLIVYYIFKIINRFFRHLNIRKHGWPPEYCDADGDQPLM